MRFTPALFVSAVAASYYQAAPVSSSTPAAADHGYGGKASSTAAPSSSAGGYGGYWPKASSSSSAVSSKKGGPKKWKTTTSYETECYTVTSSSSTKVWTSVKAIPTVCEDDDDEDSWVKPSVKTSAKSTPYSPVKPTGASVPYCSAVTETCTVTVTAAAGSDYTPKPKPTTPVAPVVPSAPYAPAAPSAPGAPVVPVAPVYSASTADSWGAYPKPSGTGSYTKPKAPEFTGAASIQKAGALLAGAGAVAAMLL